MDQVYDQAHTQVVNMAEDTPDKTVIEFTPRKECHGDIFTVGYIQSQEVNQRHLQKRKDEIGLRLVILMF